MPRHSFRLEKSSGFCHPGAFQLALASLAATTGVKSAAYSMGRWRFTESLSLCSHPLTPESCSASIRPMAKARKPTSSSSRRSEGTARSQSKSQKKKTFPPPPPSQRGGVELVDPLVQAQLKVYDEALALFHQQKFARSK